LLRKSNIIVEPTTNGAVQKLILNAPPVTNKFTFWIKSQDISSIADENNKTIDFTDS